MDVEVNGSARRPGAADRRWFDPTYLEDAFGAGGRGSRARRGRRPPGRPLAASELHEPNNLLNRHGAAHLAGSRRSLPGSGRQRGAAADRPGELQAPSISHTTAIGGASAPPCWRFTTKEKLRRSRRRRSCAVLRRARRGARPHRSLDTSVRAAMLPISSHVGGLSRPSLLRPCPGTVPGFHLGASSGRPKPDVSDWDASPLCARLGSRSARGWDAASVRLLPPMRWRPAAPGSAAERPLPRAPRASWSATVDAGWSAGSWPTG